MATVMEEKLKEAETAKKNDVKTFVWKFAKQSDGTQPEKRLIDCDGTELQKFYDHCKSMLYSTDKKNPGRYVLLDMIREQRDMCNVELFVRKLESGDFSSDDTKCPRFTWLQRILDFKKQNKEYFTENDFDSSPITVFLHGVPVEFSKITLGQLVDCCLDKFGTFNSKHITFNFILNLGICLTSKELDEFNGKDLEGKRRSKMEMIKEQLNIRPNVKLTVKAGGLTFSELRAMLILRAYRTKKYSELTTEQLTILRNKILYRLEGEVNYHATTWEKKMQEIEKVAEYKDIYID